MFLGCVIDDKVHDQLHITLLHFFDEVVDISQGAIHGVDILIIGNIVAHICLWALVDRRYPYYVHAEVLEVVKLLGDAWDISPSIAICVEEGCWIDLSNLLTSFLVRLIQKIYLVYNGLLPPSMLISTDV